MLLAHSARDNDICNDRTRCLLDSKYTKNTFAAEPRRQTHIWCI